MDQAEIVTHNCAPCHRSNVATDFLKTNKVCSGLARVYPRFESIENACVISNDNVTDTQPTSSKCLQEVITDVSRTGISAENCKTVINSMPRRLEAIIKNGGGHIKY